MLETEEFIIVHTPKCGGTTLRRHSAAQQIYGHHEGIFMLSEEQRRKPIFALTRDPRLWYESFFRYSVEAQNPWLEEFGIPYVLDEATFRAFLRRATIAPPETQRLVIPNIRVPFDSFKYMRTRRRGFWSFWHEFLCSDDPQDLRIAPDVQFVQCGDPRFFPPVKENTSAPLAIRWDRESLECLRADAEIADVVASQMIPADLESVGCDTLVAHR